MMSNTIVIFAIVFSLLLIIVGAVALRIGLKTGLAIKEDPVGVLHIDSHTADGDLLTVELCRPIPELQNYTYVIFRIDNKTE